MSLTYSECSGGVSDFCSLTELFLIKFVEWARSPTVLTSATEINSTVPASVDQDYEA